MNLYLIDYENVNEAGLSGVRELKKEDQVHIFYSDRIKTMPFQRGMEMAQSQASIEFIKTHKVAKNYLDFQLSTYLGYLIGSGLRGQVFIISKDAGFDSVVDFWKGRNINICRKDSIAYKPPIKDVPAKDTPAKDTAAKSAPAKTTPAKNTPAKTAPAKNTPAQSNGKRDLPEMFRKKIRGAVKEDKLAPSCYTTIYKGMVESDEKMDLNNALVKAFGSTVGGSVYGKIKIIFEEYKKMIMSL